MSGPDCAGVAVPLLPTTISGTATVGCGGYTTQPTANNCPTAPPAPPSVLSANPSPPSVPSNAPSVNPATPSVTQSNPPTSTAIPSASPGSPSASPGSPSASPGTPPKTAPGATTTAPAPASSQSSVTDAFAVVSQSETTLIADGTTQYYSKSTFSDLATITAPITVTTPIVQTNSDNSQFTISAAIVIVGPGGTWYVTL